MGDDYWVEEGLSEKTICQKRKRRVRVRKIEFVGWASKPLTEFLEAINVDSKKEYSKLQLVTFISKYINEKGLAAQGKKKKSVICDERLFSLFEKKTVSRKKIYELLEEHLHENSDDSGDTSEEEEDNRGRTFTSLRAKCPRSFFAAVVPENIKVIYLKRSLIKELLQDPASFERKIIGSFVRMKPDPNDIFHKHQFQLQLVTGVENFSLAVSSGAEIHLKVANFFKEVPISILSDENFSEEEVEDVRRRIEAGTLKKFTIEEMEMKAGMLHKDITQHWIAKELSLLQKKIDHANEKGWRRELLDYLTRRKMLQTPSEQEKLLFNIPQVIAQEPEAPATPAPGNAHFSKSTQHGFLEPPVASETCASHEGTATRSVDGSWEENHQNDHADFLPTESNGLMHDEFPTGNNLEEAYQVETGDDMVSEVEPERREMQESAVSIDSSTSEHELVINAENSTGSMIQDEITMETGFPATQVVSSAQDLVPPAAQGVTIELSSDDEEEPEPEPEPDADAEVTDVAVWHYVDPRGRTRGPFSLRELKRWNEAAYFHQGFTVWKTGQTPADSVVLADVLRRSFTSGTEIIDD